MATQIVCDGCGKAEQAPYGWATIIVHRGELGTPRELNLCLGCLPPKLSDAGVIAAFMIEAIENAQRRLGIKTKQRDALT